MGFRRCAGPSSAYAGAWLAHTDTVLGTTFGDKLGMEYHDFYMFHQGGNTRPRVAVKTAALHDFWVDHMSGYEHRMKAHATHLKVGAQSGDLEGYMQELRRFSDKVLHDECEVPLHGGETRR